MFNNEYKKRGIELIENTPTEILEVSIEMLERLTGRWINTTENKELQEKYGSWILISAGITKGRKMTAFWSIEADVRNSGADYQHKAPIVIDGNLITSPHYNNNGDFMKAVIEYFDSEK